VRVKEFSLDVREFDSFAQWFVHRLNRRTILGWLRGMVLTAGATGLPTEVVAKQRSQPASLNQFGCIDVGQKCRGQCALCCSGVFTGKKPKKGKKDNRTCIAHGAGICTPALNFCVAQNAIDSLCNLPSTSATCFLTTGNAGFCGEATGFNPLLNCRLCSTDKDCESFGFPVGSACTIIQGNPGCDNVCAATQGRGCLPPAI
jgi:hypothetical protein